MAMVAAGDVASTTIADKLIRCVPRHQVLLDEREAHYKCNDCKDSARQSIDQLGSLGSFKLSRQHPEMQPELAGLLKSSKCPVKTFYKSPFPFKNSEEFRSEHFTADYLPSFFFLCCKFVAHAASNGPLQTT